MTTGQKLTIIREFLALTCVTHAVWGSDHCVTLGSPWRLLRDYAANPGRATHWRAPVWLIADRDGWRDGVRVVI